jgi:hypothetical protein
VCAAGLAWPLLFAVCTSAREECVGLLQGQHGSLPGLLHKALQHAADILQHAAGSYSYVSGSPGCYEHGEFLACMLQHSTQPLESLLHVTAPPLHWSRHPLESCTLHLSTGYWYVMCTTAQLKLGCLPCVLRELQNVRAPACTTAANALAVSMGSLQECTGACVQVLEGVSCARGALSVVQSLLVPLSACDALWQQPRNPASLLAPSVLDSCFVILGKLPAVPAGFIADSDGAPTGEQMQTQMQLMVRAAHVSGSVAI